jgi:osomolarity two-component system response regulator SKN7
MSLAASLQKEINNLKETQKDMTDKLKGFDKKYSAILQSIEGFKKNMEEQDSLMRNIMDYVSKQSK